MNTKLEPSGEATIDSLIQIIETENDNIKLARQSKSIAERELSKLLHEQVTKELSNNDYGCGTATIETNTHTIKAEVKKKVSWDKEKLKELAEDIESTGTNPEVYMDITYSMKESFYKNLPIEYQDKFKVARSVEPSKPTFNFTSRIS